MELVVALGIAIFGIVWADSKCAARRHKEEADLEREARFDELGRVYEARLRERRPFLWLLNMLFTRGVPEAKYGAHLVSIGLGTHALSFLETAERIARIDVIRKMARAMQAQALSTLGRYDDAEAILAADLADPGCAAVTLAIASGHELRLGRTARAVAHGNRGVAADAREDSVRMALAHAHMVRGELLLALRSVDYLPADITRLYSEADLRRITSDPDWKAAIDAQVTQTREITQPSRLLIAAHVCLEQGDAPAAEGALGKARGCAGQHPVVRALLEVLSARAAAMRGEAEPARAHAALALEAADRLPTKPSLRDEVLGEAAVAELALGAPERAAAHLAGRGTEHPLDRHVMAYWTGRVHEAAGRPAEAEAAYRRVLGDAFETWMARDAAERVARASATA